MTRLVYSRSSLPGETVCGLPYWWFHYLIIEDGRTTVINMKRALFGMNFGNVDVIEDEGTAEQIIDWKRRSGDDRLREVPKDEGERVLAWLALGDLAAAICGVAFAVARLGKCPNALPAARMHALDVSKILSGKN